MADEYNSLCTRRKSMKVVYENEKYQIKKYTAEPVYMLIDKDAKEFLVAEGRLAQTLRDTLEMETPLIDITLDGLMHLGRQYGQVEALQRPL